ncbi:MAG: polysaccharide biosynthesis C-terminal domain-containing protein [Vicingaceae bacterium]
MKPNQKTIKRSKYIGLEAINFVLRPLHTSLVSLLIVRLFNVDLWGEFVFFLISAELVNTVLNWGQKPFLLREFSLKPNKINEYWSQAIYARIPLLFLAFILLSVTPVFRSYFIPLLLFIVFKWLGGLFESYIQFYRKYLWSISASVLGLLTALFCVYFFKNKMTLEVLIYIFSFSSFIQFITLLPLISKWKIPKISTNKIKTGLLLSLPFFALSIAGLVQTKGDLYIVTYFLKESQVANYQIIIGFLILAQTFSAIILGPFQKNIYRWRKKNTFKLKKLYLQIGFVVSIVFTVILYFVLNNLYLISLSIWHLPLFFAYLYPLYIYLIESQLLLKHKKEKLLLKDTLIAAFFNILTALFLVPFYGIYGALFSGIICRLILAGLVLHHSKEQ